MTSTYLIDITDFQRRADISQNLKTDKLKAQIGITQEKYVVKVICQDLYDQIISQYPSSLSVANTALLPYIQDFLIYKTYARYLINANVSATPAGIVKVNDSTAERPSPEEMTALVRQAQSDANFYQDKLVNFLLKNEDTYTLWKDSICYCAKNRRPVNVNRFSAVGRNSSDTPLKWT